MNRNENEYIKQFKNYNCFVLGFQNNFKAHFKIKSHVHQPRLLTMKLQTRKGRGFPVFKSIRYKCGQVSGGTTPHIFNLGTRSTEW